MKTSVNSKASIGELVIMIIVTIVIIPWIKYPGGGGQITREDRWQKGMKRMGQLEMMGTGETGKAPGRADKKAAGEEAGRRRVPQARPAEANRLYLLIHSLEGR